MKRLVCILILILNCSLYSGTDADTTYNVSLSGSISPLLSFFRDERYSGNDDFFFVGSGVTVKGMWHPGRLLSVGIMTGYMYIAGDEWNPGIITKARLSAIPLQAVIAMGQNNFEIGVGIGSYLMISSIDNGVVSNGVRTELALTLFSSYYFINTDKLSFGPELKAAYLRYRGIFTFMPSLNIRINLYRY